MKLYSAWYCPFAQRAWMTLLLKGINFEYIEVDPYQQSDGWLRISRNSAKVPVLIAPTTGLAGEATIIDSTRIVEYLDELAPKVHPLLPSDPTERAEQRYWMDQINQEIVPYLYRFLQAKDTGNYRDKSRQNLIAGLEKHAAAMSDEGPFFNGKQLTAIDVLLIPFAYRIEVLLGHYRDFMLPQGDETWSRYHGWYQAMLQQSVFKATSVDHENYRQRLIDFYLPYSQGEGQKDVAQIN